MHDEDWNILNPDSLDWLPCDIVDYYDAHLPSMKKLAKLTGRTISELNKILSSEV